MREKGDTGGCTTPIPHVTLDLRGSSSPPPVIVAKRALAGMRSGEVLQLVIDCTAAIDDIVLWAREASLDFLLQLELASGVQELYLRKRG